MCDEPTAGRWHPWDPNPDLLAPVSVLLPLPTCSPRAPSTVTACPPVSDACRLRDVVVFALTLYPRGLAQAQRDGSQGLVPSKAGGQPLERARPPRLPLQQGGARSMRLKGSASSGSMTWGESFSFSAPQLICQTGRKTPPLWACGRAKRNNVSRSAVLREVTPCSQHTKVCERRREMGPKSVQPKTAPLL